MAALPPELQPAYELFLGELKTHLTAIEEKLTVNHEALQSGSIAEEQLEVLRKALEHRFHVIRGGAGFFQLTEVRATAEEGEKAFRKGRTRQEYLQTLAELVPQAIKNLKHALST